MTAQDRSDQYDDWREQLIRREWDVDGAPSECATCGAPIQWTGRGFLHVVPSVPRKMHGEPGGAAYAAGQIAWGYDIGAWILRTSDHQAVMR